MKNIYLTISVKIGENKYDTLKSAEMSMILPEPMLDKIGVQTIFDNLFKAAIIDYQNDQAKQQFELDEANRIFRTGSDN
jgi:hypothetical protein